MKEQQIKLKFIVKKGTVKNEWTTEIRNITHQICDNTFNQTNFERLKKNKLWFNRFIEKFNEFIHYHSQNFIVNVITYSNYNTRSNLIYLRSCGIDIDQPTRDGYDYQYYCLKSKEYHLLFNFDPNRWYLSKFNLDVKNFASIFIDIAQAKERSFSTYTDDYLFDLNIMLVVKELLF